ncbi:hypothetical protein [Sneathiella chinensis]|uniref:Uncharacterized protein n=1 Tax=Sneathiella chinensis TaxID=349750 RepID=A0ABQ5U6E4_9PROT|nr:hypothetical protein [Sneathiella chinensis]GLQ06056.1 hypothetical protein GCM10007924_12770 [Sneathiella chinensis]
MFSFFKKSKPKADSEVIRGLLEILYFSPSAGTFFQPIPIISLNKELRIKVLLFTYGFIDCYCQSSGKSNTEFSQIVNEVDDFILSTTGISLVEFVCSEEYRKAFKDPYLLKIIKIGGKTYNDFASKDEELGGQSIIRLRGLIDLWQANYDGRITKLGDVPLDGKEPDFEKIRNELQASIKRISDKMHVDDTAYSESEDLKKIYSERKNYNYVLKSISNQVITSLNDSKSFDEINNIYNKYKNIDNLYESIPYLYFKSRLRNTLLSGFYHESADKLSETGATLLNIYDKINDQLGHLKTLDYNALEEDFTNIRKDIANIDTSMKGELLVNQIKTLFDLAMPSEKLAIAKWTAKQLGSEFKSK